MMHTITRPLSFTALGSEDLYNMARAALIARGSSLNRWCKEQGVNRQTAERALRGTRDGKSARDIRARIIAELFDGHVAGA